jgi:hypothetical protein
MIQTLLLLLLLLLGNSSFAFNIQSGKNFRDGTNNLCFATKSFDDSSVSRRDAIIHGMIGSFAMGSSLLANPSAVQADVSDGNALPQGAAQFSRVLRLKSDLQGVKKRVVTGGDDISKQEWDNIGKFLRTAYGVGDDMKSIAGGIADQDKKKRALNDVDLVRQYIQAGDIPVNKNSADGLVPVLEKMSALVEDFLDSLSDVPDEI